MADFSVVAKLMADASNFTKGVNEAKNALQDLPKSAGQAMQQVGSAMQSVGKGMTAAVTAPIVGVGAAAVKLGVDFDDSMRRVQATAGASGEELQQLESIAREMGATTRYSASQAANGLEYMALAGWDTEQMISALPGVLNLAAAGGMDLARASDIVTDTMSMFGMEATEATRAADVFAAAQSKSNTNTEQLGEALVKAGPAAASAGESLESTSAILGILANNGIKGSRAGTTLSAMFRDLRASAEDGAVAIGDTAVAVYDATGEMRPMVDIIADIEGATEGMTDAQRDAALAGIFQQQSLSGLLPLLGSGTDSIYELQDALENSNGTAAEMAEIMEGGLGGAFRNLRSALEEAALSIFRVLEPAIRSLGEHIQAAVDWFNSLDNATKENIVKWALIAAAIGPVLIILGTLFSAIGKIIGVFGALGKGLTLLGGAGKVASAGAIASGVSFAALGAKLLMIAGVVAIVVTALVVLAQHADEVKVVILALAEAVGIMVVALGEALASVLQSLGSALAEVARAIGSAISEIITAVTPIVEIIGGVFVELAGIIAGAIVQIVQALAPFIPAITEMVTEAVSQLPNIISAFSELVESVGSSVTELVTAISEGLSEIISATTELVETIGTAISDVVTSISKGVTDIIDAFGDLAEDLTPMIEEVANLVETVGEAIEGVAESIGSAIEGVLEKVAEIILSIGESAKTAGEGFDIFAGALERIVGLGIGDTVSTVGDLVKHIRDLNKAGKSLPGAVQALESLGEALNGIYGVSALATDFAAFNLSLDGLGEKAQASADGVSALKTAREGIYGISDLAADFTAFGLSLVDVGPNATTASTAMTELGTTATTLSTTISSAMSAIESAVTKAMDSIQQATSKAMSDMESSTSKALSTMSSQFTSNFSTMQSTTSSAMSAIQSTITSGMASVLSTIQSTMNSAVSAMNSAAGQAQSAGYNMGLGFYNGLSSMSGSIIGLARSIANSAAAAMRSALAIRSPSRVMTKIGEQTGEGAVVGMGNMIPGVIKASRNLANAMIPDISPSTITGELNRLTGGNLNGGYTFNGGSLDINQQPATIYLSMGNNVFRTYVRDITEVQEAELRLEF